MGANSRTCTPPGDGSLHMTLAPDDVQEELATGWGEFHPWVHLGWILPNVLMVYAPRTGREVDLVASVLEAPIFGLLLAMAGMLLGIQMASSHNHTQHVTHAHMLLLGFVLSAIYRIVYRLWLEGSAPVLAMAHTVLHQAGTVVLVLGLYLL